jgi:hypothetical protein
LQYSTSTDHSPFSKEVVFLLPPPNVFGLADKTIFKHSTLEKYVTGKRFLLERMSHNLKHTYLASRKKLVGDQIKTNTYKADNFQSYILPHDCKTVNLVVAFSKYFRTQMGGNIQQIQLKIYEIYSVIFHHFIIHLQIP